VVPPCQQRAECVSVGDICHAKALLCDGFVVEMRYKQAFSDDKWLSERRTMPMALFNSPSVTDPLTDHLPDDLPDDLTAPRGRASGVSP